MNKLLQHMMNAGNVSDKFLPHLQNSQLKKPLVKAQDGWVQRAADANLNFWEKCRLATSADNGGGSFVQPGDAPKQKRYNSAYEELADLKGGFFDKDQMKEIKRTLPQGVSMDDWVAFNREAGRFNAKLSNPDYGKYTDSTGMLKPEWQSVATNFDPYYLYYKPHFNNKSSVSPQDLLNFYQSQPGGVSNFKTLINNGYRMPQHKKGGPIVDSRGQWAHPGKVTRIPSSSITMQGVPYPVYGVGDNGQSQMMYPGMHYDFGGASYVDEYPMMQAGGRAPIYTSDPNDPRLKAYRDSTNSFNLNEKIPKGYVPLTPELAKGHYSGPLKNMYYHPTGSLEGTPSITYYATAEKPVQPVILQEHPMVGKSLNFGPVDFERNISSPSGGLPVGKTLQQPVSNYSVTYRDENSPSKQRTQYLPDLETWKNFTDNVGYMHRSYSGDNSSASALIYNPNYKNGGYIVTRSHDRKGKTHKVTGPDGTVKYFGDSKLGQHPDDPERKKAFYARHKKNLDKNPYFRAFARATWEEGGEIYEMQAGGQKRMTFDQWYKTVPQYKNDTSSYNLRRAYDLAPQQQLDAFVNNPEAHLYSAYENPKSGIWEFMKSRNHPTIEKELEWFNSNDPSAIQFRKKYKLDTVGDYYRYVPKRESGGQTSDDREMLEGVADMLRRVKDAKNRKEIADYMMGNFRDENVTFEPKDFLQDANVFAQGGEMIRRADGSYSRRGLWDNIRANRGSGKHPTKEMLEQERKIKASMQDGGSFAEDYLNYLESNNNLPKNVPVPFAYNNSEYNDEQPYYKELPTVNVSRKNKNNAETKTVTNKKSFNNPSIAQGILSSLTSRYGLDWQNKATDEELQFYKKALYNESLKPEPYTETYTKSDNTNVKKVYPKVISDEINKGDKLSNSEKRLLESQAEDRLRFDNLSAADKALYYGDVLTDVMQLGNFVPHPIGQRIGKAGNFLGSWIDGIQAARDFTNGDYGLAAVNAASLALPSLLGSNTFRRNSKYLRPGQLLYPLSPQAGILPGAYRRVHYIEPFNNVRGMTSRSLLANRALLGTLGAETIYDSYEMGGQTISNNKTNTMYFQNGGSFGDAFTQARKQGLSSFQWKGKTYTTQIKEEQTNTMPVPTRKEKPAAAPSKKPAASNLKHVTVDPRNPFYRFFGVNEDQVTGFDVPNDVYDMYQQQLPNNKGKKFGVVSKNNAKAYFFDQDGNLAVQDEVGLGTDRGEAQPVFYKVKTTPSGTYQMTRPKVAGPAADRMFNGYDSKNFFYLDNTDPNKRLVDIPGSTRPVTPRQAVHGIPKNLKGKRLPLFDNGDVSDNNMSAGCINCRRPFLDNPYFDDFEQGFVYVTPEQLQKREGGSTFSGNAWYQKGGGVKDKRKLDSGTIVDKGSNTLYVIKNGKVVQSSPVLTGQAGRNYKTDPDSNGFPVSYLEAHPEDRSTPTGTYFMKPNPNIYGWPGFNLKPIEAFEEDAPNARATAMHVTYGAKPKPGLRGHVDPEEFRRRNAGYSQAADKRYMSYGCTNMKGEMVDCLSQTFPQGDTAVYVDSRNPVDMEYIRQVKGMRKNGGYVGSDGKRHVSNTPTWSGNVGYEMGGYIPEMMYGAEMAYGGGLPCLSCGGSMYKSGGPVVGDEMEVTPQQLEQLRQQGYQFEII